MGKRIAGVAYVKVDGSQFALRGGLTVSPDRFERTGIAGQDRVHGYSEMPRVPSIVFDGSLVPELSLEAAARITNATITAELASGHVYVLRNAWASGAREINAADGQVSITFEGEDCHEITPAT